MDKGKKVHFDKLLAQVIKDEGGRSVMKMGDAREFTRKLARRIAISAQGDRNQAEAFFDYCREESAKVSKELQTQKDKALKALK